MSQAILPDQIPVEFLRYLSETISPHEPVALILRGSVLLRHWFGPSARPAADLDLECFDRGRGASTPAQGQRFPTLIDNGRALCAWAAEASVGYPPAPHGLVFEEVETPVGGHNLWEYGAPGERFFVGWVWHDRQGQSGQLQIDIAAAGAYPLHSLPLADVEMTGPGGHAFRFPAYTSELMLAAKLSWLLRGFTRKSTNDSLTAPAWQGEPKDIYDVHLLLTKADIRASVFQQALLAVGTEDKIDWSSLDVFFGPVVAQMTDEHITNWGQFHHGHPELTGAGPVQLLHTIAERLEPLLGDFYPRAEIPFLQAINAAPLDEYLYLVYADWLEERGDSRASFLRHFATLHIRLENLQGTERNQIVAELQAALGTMSVPWLHRLFGDPSRFHIMRERIERDQVPGGLLSRLIDRALGR